MLNPATDHGPAAIHVAAATDAGYLMPLGVMLSSLRRTLDVRTTLHAHVLGDRLEEGQWQSLEACVGPRDTLHRHAVDVTRELGSAFRTRAFEHISPACFLRLLLPELLPLPRVLYLDCDLLVRADVTSLWNFDLQGACLGAAAEESGDGRAVQLAPQLRHASSLALPAGLPVYNVGVMLLDLDAWRRTRLAERTFAYLRAAAGDVRWYEQEALNVCAWDQLRALPARWNLPPSRAARLPPAEQGIVHYLTARKPWNWDYDLPLRDEFLAALDASPWRGWRPSPPALGKAGVALARLRKAVAKRREALARLLARSSARAAAGALQPSLLAGPGAQRWRVWLGPGEQVVDEQGVARSPQELAARCAAQGIDALEAWTDESRAEPLAGWTARDPRDGALFLGRARVRPPTRACDPPRFATRIVIARDSASLRVDAAAAVFAGAAVGAQPLRIIPAP